MKTYFSKIGDLESQTRIITKDEYEFQIKCFKLRSTSPSEYFPPSSDGSVNAVRLGIFVGNVDVGNELVLLDVWYEETADLPKLVPMTSLPKGCNPFHYDTYNMGCELSGAWVAMYNQHAGLKQDHNLSNYERVRRNEGEVVYYDDPEYIILVNTRTGQRFRLQFPPKSSHRNAIMAAISDQDDE